MGKKSTFMQIPNIKPIAKKIILPAVIAGGSIAAVTPALTETDKNNNVIEYMAASPTTQSAALFGLFGLFGKKKEESVEETQQEKRVNEPAHDRMYFYQTYRSIKDDLFYGDKEEVCKKIDKFLNELEEASVNPDSFNITNKAFDYIKANIQENRREVVNSDVGCNVHFVDQGLEMILPRLIQDCILPFEKKDWIDKCFEMLDRRDDAQNIVLKNIINNQ